MLNPIKKLLSQLFAPSHATTLNAHDLQLATAVLLLEVMRADASVSTEERVVLVRALRENLSLNDDDVSALLAQAQQTAQGANDYFRFTSAMNERLTQAQKIEVVEMMWRVAFADGHLDEHENHLISKIAGLLHVTHGEYIAAKMHARTARF